MKPKVLLLIAVAMLMVCFIGCNPEPEPEDINNIHKMLIGEWALCKNDIHVDTIQGYDRIEYWRSFSKQSGYFDTIYEHDILNTKVLKFTNDECTMGTIAKGEISYSGKDKYSIFKNEYGKPCIKIIRDMDGNNKYLYYVLDNISQDSIKLCYIDSSYASFGIYSRRYSYYVRPDLEYAKNKNARMMAAQQKMQGEWYVEKMHIVTDYENGYTAENGATHIDTTIVYTGETTALKINCEHVPAVDNTPSTFSVGTYSGGKATYDITPTNPKYKTDGSQWYTVMMDDDGNFSAYFRCYLPTLTQDGKKYYLKDTGFLIYDQTKNSMTTERNDGSSIRQTINGEIKTISVYHSKVTEYWKRQ